jgi:glycerol-3-phosphate dehydrogenase
MTQVAQEAKTEVQVYRAEHIEELRKLREQLQDFLIPAEKRIELALKIIAQDAKFKATEMPTRSENVNVNLDGDAIGPYRQFVLASRGLDAEQVERLLTLAREMPRKPFVQVAPPKSSPLWDVPQLTEGTDEDA